MSLVRKPKRQRNVIIMDKCKVGEQSRVSGIRALFNFLLDLLKGKPRTIGGFK